MQTVRRQGILWSILVLLTPVFLFGCSSTDSDPDTQGTLSAPKGATALSNHYVEVQFDRPVGAAAGLATSYTITGPNATPLAVTAAQPSADSTSVVLTTDSQEAVEYTLNVRETTAQAPRSYGIVRSAFADVSSVSVTFTGSLDTSEPALETAISLDNTTVLLTFSERMNKAAAENVTFYRIAAPDLRISSAVLSADELTVRLTTSPQDNVSYSVKVTNVKSLNGSKIISPLLNTATFSGIPPVDVTAPQVVKAVSTNSTTVIVSFSEPLADAATDPRNFTICHATANPCTADLTVTNAQFNAYKTQVILSTLPQEAGLQYKVMVSNVRDRAIPPPGNLISATANATTFTFAGTPSVTDGSQLPRLVSAASTGNTTVVVQFSKPMSDSALTASNYVIVQENVNPEVGFLVVRSARFLSTVLRTSVELSTLPQNEVTYRITAGNVEDLAGNPLAPPIISQGVLVDPRTATFPGSPPSVVRQCSVEASNAGDVCTQDSDCPNGTCGLFVDSDGDKLADSVEQRGWVVRITLVGGTVIERQVTSDPFVADTDGDGLDDLEEYRLVSNPRAIDTDGDRLNDFEEFNVIFVDLNKQDTDGDGIDDNLETEFFKTNALVADTDGDGFSDGQELFELNRNARVADLPQWQIRVGDVRLQIDERFTFVNEQGQTVSVNSSTSTTLTQSSETTEASSDISTHTFLAEVGVAGGVSGDAASESFNAGFGVLFLEGSVNLSTNNEWTHQSSTESKTAAENAFEQSQSKGVEVTGSRSSTREVVGARIDVDVNVKNIGDVAFSIKNLEITVLAPSPQERGRFLPVATLVPNSTLITGQPAVFSLGPLDAERGPILFSNREVFPNLIENLMREPRGLLFKVANFDITDESGRIFAFASQTVRDRTVGIVIDYGDGTVERFHIAVNPALDKPRDQGGTIIGGFDANGKPAGFSLDFALQNALGLSKNRQTPDAIVAGPNGTTESLAEGDDVQTIVGGIDGVPEDTVVITAGENGILDTTPRGDDQAVVTTGYETTKTCSADTPGVLIAGSNGRVDTLRDGDDVQVRPFGTTGLAANAVIISAGVNTFIDTPGAGDDIFLGPGVPCTVNTDCPGGSCSGREALLRFKHRKRAEFGRFWAIITPDLSQVGLDFGQIVVRGGQTIGLAFVQDRDRDGLIAQQEYLYGSSDTKQDTDNDSLDDFAEARIGWEVTVLDGRPIRKVFSDPQVADSDRDGLSDPQEQDLRRVKCECVGGTNDGQSCTSGSTCGTGTCRDLLPIGTMCTAASCPICPSQAIRLDPRQRDTDNDSVDDDDEVRGFLSGAGIVDPRNVILAGNDRDADTRACPLDACVAGVNVGLSCRRDLDCPGSTCNITGCDDVQVVPVGTLGLDPRTVVVGPGLNGVLNTTAASGDTTVSTGNLAANTRAVGDDKQVIGVGVAVTAGGAVVKPGPNGVLDSVPAGDDVLFLGQVFKITDALSSDTDVDQVPDGIEQLLGSDPTDPTDSGNFADRDEDGLTDAEESQFGWTVAVTSLSGVTTTSTVFSNPNVPDSDLDGLPDFMERELGLNPNASDTDGDGLSDFDELSADQFAQFARFNSFFRGFFVDGSTSKQYGTDARKVDTDGDSISDRSELLVGFSIAVPGESAVRQGFTDPKDSDTDRDGLSDSAEISVRKTDPTDPDTDSDNRLDGAEVTAGTNPLIQDIAVTVRYALLDFTSGPNDGTNGVPDWIIRLSVQRPSDSYPGVTLSSTYDACPQSSGITLGTYGQLTCSRQPEPEGLGGFCSFGNSSDFFLNASRTFSLRAGQGFVINGFFGETEACASATSIPVLSCALSFNQAFNYETLVASGFTSQLIVPTLDGGTGCGVKVLVEIEVN